MNLKNKDIKIVSNVEYDREGFFDRGFGTTVIIDDRFKDLIKLGLSKDLPNLYFYTNRGNTIDIDFYYSNDYDINLSDISKFKETIFKLLDSSSIQYDKKSLEIKLNEDIKESFEQLYYDATFAEEWDDKLSLEENLRNHCEDMDLEYPEEVHGKINNLLELIAYNEFGILFNYQETIAKL